MKRTHFILSGVLAAFVATVCAACSPAPDISPAPPTEAGRTPETAATSQTGFPVEITDLLGNTTTISSADRIISLSPAGTQVLMAIGAEDQIIGVDASSADLLAGPEVVGDYTDPNVEKMIALEPDVVIAANYIQDSAIERLRDLGIPVVAAEPTAWEQIPESFEMIASAAGQGGRGRVLADDLQSAVDEARTSAPSAPVSCYYVLSYGNAGNWTSGEGSFINTMLEYAGGAPITAGTASTWLEYPIEDLAAHDPQVILLADDAGTVEDFMQTSGYEDLSAVRTGRVYAVDADLLSVPGPNLAQAVRTLSGILAASAEESADAPAAA